MRRYYLHTRKNGIFYAELVTPEGNKLTARSTGTKSRDEALLIIAKWLESGIPTGRVRKPAAAIEGRIAYHIDKLYQKGIIAARYSCHDFRHFFAVHEYKKNKDIFRLSKLLNHAGIQITQTYLKSLGIEL
jgi:integrase